MRIIEYTQTPDGKVPEIKLQLDDGSTKIYVEKTHPVVKEAETVTVEAPKTKKSKK